MRKFLLILLIFIYKNTFCQLNDNFSDGDFTNNPTWAGQDATTNFIIVDGQLRSNSSALNSNFYLSTANNLALNCTWEFDVSLMFTTSGNNYVDFYIISNTADLKSTNINGYFVRVGHTAKDISLFKRSGATSTSVKIIDGVDGVVGSSSNNSFRIKVTRTSGGIFGLEWDKSLTGNSYEAEGVATDNTYTSTSFFGLLIQQSIASFINKHFFGNFLIKALEVDNTPPQLAGFSFESDKITLTFNKFINPSDAILLTNYIVKPSNINPTSVTALGKKVTLNFASPFANGKYSLAINNIKDIFGNIASNITKDFRFIVPDMFSKKEILINEVLFNPRTGGAKFVEVYNNTNKTFNFKDLYLATVNDKDSLTTMRAVTSSTILFEPHTYWVLTTNPDIVKTEYFTSAPDNFIKVASIPSYNIDKGVVVLADKDSNRVDQLNYTEKMHFPLLKNVKGVSLERSYFDEDTNKPGNFRSATATVGYATPGFKNSQYLIPVESNEVISFSSKTFSPDNDGFEDVLTISYNINETGYVANVTIYDDNGRLVKKLVSNETISANGTWIWDGFNSKNDKVKAGIYIVYAEFFNLNGDIKKYKKTITAASKFN